MPRIVAISDTHNRHNNLLIPECDVLIHAGDATGRGQYQEIKNFATWFSQQPAKHKIFVPGNHELVFENMLPNSFQWFYENCNDGILLIEDEIVIDGIRFYGSPITPFFMNWAWNRHIWEIKAHWDKIPDNTNVLITHGPPDGILDELTYVNGVPNGKHVGCIYLKERIQELKYLTHHIFGHIHGHGGKRDGKHYNVSICDELYNPDNPITIIDI